MGRGFLAVCSPQQRHTRAAALPEYRSPLPFHGIDGVCVPPQLTTDTQCRQGVREVPDPAPGTLLAAGEAGLLTC